MEKDFSNESSGRTIKMIEV